jgi:hypothetical protein
MRLLNQEVVFFLYLLVKPVYEAHSIHIQDFSAIAADKVGMGVRFIAVIMSVGVQVNFQHFPLLLE